MSFAFADLCLLFVHPQFGIILYRIIAVGLNPIVPAWSLYSVTVSNASNVAVYVMWVGGGDSSVRTGL
ncbi:hypothetical protein L211DRAFT_832141 [Terfezia boudieri ATCC MYA-4762]|uniref:Uncharacterized protein n=1 Tax=Terfezia boudieri ATCC MYA-4762 TaxID=1051890 RepID=A0A3N4MNQ2_9PEZI|nr:hypothetical protein L211DRAFT_842190 [Terfezia boudieri ATCC MYA-4762]RPB29435.1 hypothetical protein L211DRAFT_832141 [Terfezia boudieri ATCC MYA-4762]